LGVDYRIEKLKKGNVDESRKRPYYNLLPLHELISLAIGNSMTSKSCWNIYDALIEEFENEFNILLRVEKEKLIWFIKNELLSDLIIKNREGKIEVKPGYDGVYGEALLKKQEEQKKLF